MTVTKTPELLNDADLEQVMGGVATSGGGAPSHDDLAAMMQVADNADSIGPSAAGPALILPSVDAPRVVFAPIMSTVPEFIASTFNFASPAHVMQEFGRVFNVGPMREEASVPPTDTEDGR